MRSTPHRTHEAPGSRTRRLVLFDIDGTLTQSNEMDTDSFVRAMSEHLGKPVESDWSRYRNVTDSGIAAELLQRYGRPPGDCDRVKSRFVELISQVLQSSPSCCRQVPGAGAFLDRLRHAAGVQIGLATGGWAAAARAKLSHAGIDIAGFAFASADDAPSRIEIMKICVDRMGGAGAADGIVYFGDGLWDLRATRELGWRFVGIADGIQADKLRKAGATAIFDDFRSPIVYAKVAGA
ncbi:MAG TPA: HAD family hydrolase [Tepidisphaeraceae bacterium]|nr:HAD family hydrolase [Tepidisphaeraceae bacterium]